MLGGVLVALLAVGLFYVLRRPRPHGIGAFRQKSAASGDIVTGDPGGPMSFDASGNGRDDSDSDGGWTDHGDGAADSADAGDGGAGDAGDAGGGDGGGGNGGGE